MRKSFVLVGLVAGLGLFALKGRMAHAADQAIHGPYTITERLQEYGPAVATRLTPDFVRAGVAYPPAAVTLVVLKRERELEVYARSPGGPARYIRAYPILAASGHAGPKLREGDGQVPEGIYAVESLNPNSAYHLALRIDYPNPFDRAHAATDGRTDLGGDIMIHGNDVSIGCVAMGDSAAEELFILCASVGLPHVRLIFSPLDFRKRDAVDDCLLKNNVGPAWTPELYIRIKDALGKLPLRPEN